MHKIATVINFCTNDYQFLRPCIHEVKKFSNQILIPVADHFYDGTPENRDLLSEAYQEHKEVEFIEFAYDPKRPFGYPFCTLEPNDPDWAFHWHSSARMVGFSYLRKEIEYVLFIDVDEIHDGNKFTEWLDGFDYRAYSAMRFAAYFYFREPSIRATHETNGGLLVKRSLLTTHAILDPCERFGLFQSMPNPKLQCVKGLDNVPLVHHYSWVRDKMAMLKKVTTWGHRLDKDNWASLVENEFNGPFSGKDFFSNSSYEIVEPFMNFYPQEPSHKTTSQELFRKNLESEFKVSL